MEHFFGRKTIFAQTLASSHESKKIYVIFDTLKCEPQFWFGKKQNIVNMPGFTISTKSNWNSSKKRGKSNVNQSRQRKPNNKFASKTAKKSYNNKNNSKSFGKSKTQSTAKTSNRVKNAGHDAAIRPMNTLNSSKFKPQNIIMRYFL